MLVLFQLTSHWCELGSDGKAMIHTQFPMTCLPDIDAYGSINQTAYIEYAIKTIMGALTCL